MAHGSRGFDPIEGSEGRSRSQGGESAGMQAWQRYLDLQDQQAAELEEAAAADAAREEAAAAEAQRAARAQVSLPPAPVSPIANAFAGASAIAMAGAAQAIDGPADDRTSLMLAMQAEALARLELQPHAAQVVAATHEAQGAGDGAGMERRDEHQTRLHEGQMTDREQQRGIDAIARPDDLVTGVTPEEQRTAGERLADRDHHARRGG